MFASTLLAMLLLPVGPLRGEILPVGPLWGINSQAAPTLRQPEWYVSRTTFEYGTGETVARTLYSRWCSTVVLRVPPLGSPHTRVTCVPGVECSSSTMPSDSCAR